MQLKTLIGATALILSVGGGAAFADNAGGIPGNPISEGTNIPGPTPIQPSDPAAADSRAARVPTAPEEKRAMFRRDALQPATPYAGYPYYYGEPTVTPE
jgi:hypothetical protein